MRRLIAVLLLSGVLFVLGCNKQDREENDPWPKSQWKEEFRANDLRFKSEDELNAGKFHPWEKITDPVWDQITRIWNWATGNTPFDAAKDLLDPNYADRRRRAIIWLSKREFGRKDPYVAYYAELVKNDTDSTVQSMAIRALNRVRAKTYTALYIRALDSKYEQVRLEGAKALANMPDELAMDALMKHLDDSEETIDVRVACADALRNYRTPRVDTSLVRALGYRDFGICWQARRSLKLMTGQDYHYDQAAWLEFLSKTEKPFVS